MFERAVRQNTSDSQVFFDDTAAKPSSSNKLFEKTPSTHHALFHYTALDFTPCNYMHGFTLKESSKHDLQRQLLACRRAAVSKTFCPARESAWQRSRLFELALLTPPSKKAFEKAARKTIQFHDSLFHHTLLHFTRAFICTGSHEYIYIYIQVAEPLPERCPLEGKCWRGA